MGDLVCPHYCIKCGKAGGILCGCCKKYLLGQKWWGCLGCGLPLKNGRCMRCELPFWRQFCVGARTGVLREMISVYKYESVRALSWELADLVVNRIGDFSGMVVPLPTISKHIRERGFDHIGLIAKKTGWKVAKVLKRANKAVQVGATAEMRKKQAATAYRTCGVIDPEIEYLLLDDVWTTGSSMLAAYDVMQKAGARKISVVIIAKTTN